jgi:hypothetical protein
MGQTQVLSGLNPSFLDGRNTQLGAQPDAQQPHTNLQVVCLFKRTQHVAHPHPGSRRLQPSRGPVADRESAIPEIAHQGERQHEMYHNSGAHFSYSPARQVCSFPPLAQTPDLARMVPLRFDGFRLIYICNVLFCGILSQNDETRGHHEHAGKRAP